MPTVAQMVQGMSDAALKPAEEDEAPRRGTQLTSVSRQHAVEGHESDGAAILLQHGCC